MQKFTKIHFQKEIDFEYEILQSNKNASTFICDFFACGR